MFSKITSQGYNVWIFMTHWLPKEEWKEFVHFMFEEMPYISMEQNGSRVTGNQIKQVPIKLDHEEIKRFQQENPQHSEVIKKMKAKSKTVSEDFSLDPQGILHKKRDHAKEFTTCMVPELL